MEKGCIKTHYDPFNGVLRVHNKPSLGLPVIEEAVCLGDDVFGGINHHPLAVSEIDDVQ